MAMSNQVNSSLTKQSSRRDANPEASDGLDI